VSTEEESGEDSQRQLIEILEFLSIPVDFDQLCADGILKKVGNSRYGVPDLRRLPKHVRLRIQVLRIETKMGPDGKTVGKLSWVKFEDTVEFARKALRRLKP